MGLKHQFLPSDIQSQSRVISQKPEISAIFHGHLGMGQVTLYPYKKTHQNSWDLWMLIP